MIIEFLLPPATKWGQDYIFIGVCDSVHGGRGGGIPACIAGGIPACLALGGGCYPSMPCSRGCLLPEGVPGLGGLLWGVCSRGVCSGGGGWLLETPGQPLLRAVRILLECILVSVLFTRPYMGHNL